ncbi:MAG TPA: YihY/virulence factor BrkB family protein [Gemmatimonadaceae bacterium]|nr:YihY/virulence factor BrkB family protein [Gemmatimonadaceae bacterium]
MVIKGYRVGPLLKKTGKEILADELPGLAAETAYNFFFSLFPLFLFAAPFIGLIGNEQRTLDWIMQQLASVVPPDALTLVRGVVKDVVFSKNAPGVMSLGALLALWSGSNIFRSLMDALNQAYDISESRPWWKRALLSIAAVIVTGLLILVASTVMLAGPEIVNWLGSHLHLDAVFKYLWLIVQYPLAFVLLVLAFYLIYRFLPNLKQDNKQLLVSALAASVLWIVVTSLFRLYVAHFGSYNKTYGTIGAVIILLTWMYLTMLVILSGGELASELHNGTGAIEPRKGAVYAGRVVTSTVPGRSSNDRIVPLQAGSSEQHGDSARR